MLLEGRVGPAKFGDGADAKVRLGNFGEAITNSVFGNHYDHVARGGGFIYHIASQALLLSATTGGHPTVINPLGSGVNFVPLGLSVSWTSGTTVIGSVLIAATKKVAAIATGAGSPILTATQVAPENALIGCGAVGKTLWSPTTNTFTAAPTVIMAAGINLAPADPVSGFQAFVKFDGCPVFAPGSAMSITYSVTTTTALLHTTIFGVEVPVV